MPSFLFSDHSDSMVGELYRTGIEELNNLAIQFEHVASGRRVSFKAFLEQFDDSYVSNWTETELYNRMDLIQTFKNTTREINIVWTIPSHSEEEAIDNLNQVSLLISFLYPVYETVKAIKSERSVF